MSPEGWTARQFADGFPDLFVCERRSRDFLKNLRGEYSNLKYEKRGRAMYYTLNHAEENLYQMFMRLSASYKCAHCQQ
jgi:hypothetical protein